MTPWKLSSFNFSFHGRIQIFNIRLNYSQVGKQRIPFKEIEKSKMKTSLSYQSGIEIWIKDQKAVLQIHKATWKTYVVKLFMILFTMKHRQCWLELKKGGGEKKRRRLPSFGLIMNLLSSWSYFDIWTKFSKLQLQVTSGW